MAEYHDKFGGCNVSSHIATEQVSGKVTIYYSALGKDVAVPAPDTFDSLAKAQTAAATWDTKVVAAAPVIKGG